LTDRQVAFDTLVHAPAYTAQRRAKYLHVPGRGVAKCVLLRGTTGKVLAVLPATHRVDTDAVAHELGGSFHLADDRDVAEIFNDCEWGSLAPFGTLYGLSTILDASIDPEGQIVFAGHAHAVAIRMRCCDFERLEQPRRFSFARRLSCS
jgi:Ala-tRNA(Pro) deacylase